MLVFRFLFAILLAATFSSAQARVVSSLTFSGSKVVLTDKGQTAAILSRGDSYTHAFTRFDLQGRLQKTEEVKEQEYLDLAAAEARDWSGPEQDSIKKAFGIIQAFLTKNDIKLKLPDTVVVARTTGKEELGSEGYTRGNTIVLCSGDLSVHLVAHELFHVYSRFNPAVRDALYEIIHFKKCNPILYQAAMKGRSITNPDCPVIEHYASIPLKPGSTESDNGTLIIYSDRDYTGGDVFRSYIRIGILKLDKDTRNFRPVVEDGEAVVLPLDQENMGLVAKFVGANTGYLLHPEEISAEHFAMMIEGSKVPIPASIEQMRLVLQRK